MKNLYLTVIIPTYNRKDRLLKCLEALSNQTCTKEDFEIILVDDGSTDGTQEAINSLINQYPCDLKYFKQENKGPAAARNIGIKNARGQILLFLGDDIIANNSLLEEHIKFHKMFDADNNAMLGFITWSPEIEITPFMQWLENGGPQFAFRRIKDQSNVDCEVFFYTSNISVKKLFLIEDNNLFDESFPYAAYEDNELGHRLKQKGLLLRYNEKAIGYHHHYISLWDCCQRMINVGKSLRIMEKKLSRDKLFFKNILCVCKLFILFVPAKICYPLAKYYEKKGIKPKIFKCIIKYYTYIGYLQSQP